MSKRLVFNLPAGFFILLLSCFSLPSVAQEPVPAETDTVFTEEVPLEPVPETDREQIREMPVEMVETDTLGPVPGIAAFYSAALPGLGQAYNNSHWKIPVIYIGAALVGVRIYDSHKRYSASRQNLVFLSENLDVPDVSGLTLAQWNQSVERTRRARDYAIVIGGVLYMLNIVEAYVDAHLQDFNVTDDLALQIKPSLIPVPGGSAGAGIALTLNIK